MESLTIKTLPNFSFSTLLAGAQNFENFKGHPIVLYFYPKDNTPGCTTEAQEFRDHFTQFKALDAIIFGISRDNLKSHQNFCDKYNLPFDLISDSNEELCNHFDVIKMKNMYGKQVRGIERSTFLFDATGKLHKEWRKVSVTGHAADVLAELEMLTQKEEG